MQVNPLDYDASLLRLIRILKKLELISRKTYSRIGEHMIVNGHAKKDKWRQANWKDFLKSG